MARRDTVWQETEAVRYYLDSIRGALPFAAEHFAIMLRFIASAGHPVRRFLDLGAGDGALSAVLLDRYPNAEAVVVDFSEPMLAAARDRLGSAAARFVTADLACPSS